MRATRGKDHPSAKRHTEKERKAHHTMKHMQTCPRTPSHEVCPCTHTPLEPPHARQGINKETYPPPNKPPPRAPRCRPTTHVRILCFLHSRPFTRRKEAWYEGHPYGTTRHLRAHDRHKTHVPQATRGTRRARGVPARKYAAANNKRYGCTQQGPLRMETHATPTRPAIKETASLSPFLNMQTL